MYVHEEERYLTEKKSSIELFGKNIVNEIERKILNSSSFNQFLRNQGVESRIIR